MLCSYGQYLKFIGVLGQLFAGAATDTFNVVHKERFSEGEYDDQLNFLSQEILSE
jgi:hypothetical protein